jgi:DNA-binding winged helix-turn-helix (wHTH) protein/Tfp pilus assembly protein PilF
MDPSAEIRFDGWTLLRPSGELLRDGTRIRLQTQPLQVLEELLARPGELVTREQLIARLWPKGVVDFDTALNSAVRRLRTALGDHADTPRYIETIPRRGYRFIGRLDSPVDVPQEASAAPLAPPPRSTGTAARRARWWPSAVALLVVVTAAAAVWTSQVEGLRIESVGPHASASAQANERYQRAQFFFHRRSPGDIALARQYYEQALEFDPGFAPAWAGLAGTYWIDTVHGRLPREQGLPKLLDAAERALAIDPGNAEAHLRLAAYWRSIGDPQRKDEHRRLALELEPDSPLVLVTLASDMQQEGRFDEAIDLQRRAVEADPLSLVTRYNLGSMLYQAGRLQEAETELLEVRQLNPTPEYSNETLARLMILDGRFGEAADLADPWLDGPVRQTILAMAWHGLGRAEDADAALRALTASPRSEDSLRIAEVYAFRGDVDEAFRWLLGTDDRSDATVQAARHSVFAWMIPYSPFLEPLHSDPRWNALREGDIRERELRAARIAR